MTVIHPERSIHLRFSEGVGPGEEERVERGVIIAGEEVSPPGREAVIRALDNCYGPRCRDRKISVVDMRLIEAIEIRDRKERIENGAHERLVPVRRSAFGYDQGGSQRPAGG